MEGEHYETIYDAAGAIRAKFLRGVVVDEIVNGYYYDASGAKTNYTFHHDHLQSVVGLSGHNGDVEQTTEYGPFGDQLFTTGSSPNMLGYTGRELDSETGLYYYRARYYDPEIGRFLNEDPKGFDAGINFYAYCKNNPINFNDPMGTFEEAFLKDPRVQPLLDRTNDPQIRQALATMYNEWKKQPSTYEQIGASMQASLNTPLPDGPWTMGIGFSGTYGGGYAASGTPFMFVFDSSGNFGSLESAGGGGMGGAGASGMLTFQVTNAADIYQLEGLSTQTGGSIGVGPSAGLEGIIGNGYTGANFLSSRKNVTMK